MNNEAWFHRVKAAQRDLIRLVGGIERAAVVSSVSSSHIGRMNNPRDTDLMPISVILALEADCGIPLVTSAMAELNGRKLADPDGDRAAAQSVMTSIGQVTGAAGELIAGAAAAFSDHHVTPAEAHKMDRQAADLEMQLSAFRKSLAVVKAHGGLAAGLRVVGESD